jgi:hypothetical protein
MTPAVSKTGIWISVDGRSRVHHLRLAPHRGLCIRSHDRTFGTELATLGLILVVLQILDGILTAVGMSQFGPHMEGNALLRMLMHQLGYIPAIVLVKTIAIGVVAGLCIYASRVVWLKHALRGAIVLYVTMAVLPWTYLLASEFLL